MPAWGAPFLLLYSLSPRETLMDTTTTLQTITRDLSDVLERRREFRKEERVIHGERQALDNELARVLLRAKEQGVFRAVCKAAGLAEPSAYRAIKPYAERSAKTIERTIAWALSRVAAEVTAPCA